MRYNLRELYRALGPVGFLHRFVEVLNQPEAKVRPEDISIRHLWESIVGPVSETMSLMRRAKGFVDLDLMEADSAALNTTIFQKATGALIAKKVIDAYDSTPTIGDKLTTLMPTTRKSETIVGFTAMGNLETVPEGREYPEDGFAEKYVTTGDALKKGKIIAVTEETITHDQTGQILIRAGRLGQLAARTKEITIINGIQDSDNTVFRPMGSAEALYRTSAGTNSSIINKTSANALQDWTDIDNALAIFRAMTDEAGNKIGIPGNLKLLVPSCLAAQAHYTVHATEVRTESTTANLARTAPNLPWISNLEIYSSVDLTQAATPSQSTWYIGDFAGQFVWREVWPIQVLRARRDSEDAFNRDVVAKFKVRYYGGIAAIVDHLVVQCPGA